MLDEIIILKQDKNGFIYFIIGRTFNDLSALIQCEVYTKKEQENFNNSRYELKFITRICTYNPLIWVMNKLYLTNLFKEQGFFITRKVKLVVKLR